MRYSQLFITLGILTVNLSGFAQKDTSQHSFAQTHFGVSTHFLLGGSTEFMDSLGNIQRTDLPTTFQPKLSIGAWHFWKRMDIYVAFSLPNVKWGSSNTNEYKYSAGIETGIRYYPAKIKHGTISPYFGLNWGVINYSQKVPGQSEGTRITRSVLNLETGMAFRHRGFVLELNFQYMATNTFKYPVSRNSMGNLQFSPISIGLSFKYALDFTAPAGSKESKQFNRKLDSVLVARKWNNALHIGIGPSTAFGLVPTGYNSKLRPFFDDPLPVVLCPDFGIGYYFSKPAIDIRLSLRTMFFHQEGYDFQQKLDRISVAFEVYRFLFNYKGFVPFVGAFASYEYLHLVEKDKDVTVTNVTEHMPGWGFVLGWDIRPNKNDWWVLRTNARFTPYMKMIANNENYIVSQWEFNFIQFVLYPQRLIASKQLQKNN